MGTVASPLETPRDYESWMLSRFQIKSAEIRGSEDAGFAVAIGHFVPGNFGTKHVTKTLLPERYQRLESARDYLLKAGVSEDDIS